MKTKKTTVTSTRPVAVNLSQWSLALKARKAVIPADRDTAGLAAAMEPGLEDQEDSSCLEDQPPPVVQLGIVGWQTHDEASAVGFILLVPDVAMVGFGKGFDDRQAETCSLRRPGGWCISAVELGE